MSVSYLLAKILLKNIIFGLNQSLDKMQDCMQIRNRYKSSANLKSI